MKKKIPILFFIIIYFNQGFYDLSSQIIYYLTRETWGLSATLIGLIGFITSLAWYIKILWGFLIDKFASKKGQIRNLLYINYISLLLLYSYIIIYGLNFWSLLITLTLINCFIGCNDVANDSVMVKYEQKYKLQGKLQSVQWISLGIAGLITSLLGAYIADKFTSELGIRISYLIVSIVPIITLLYLRFKWQEPIVSKKKKESFKSILKYFKNKQFLLSLLFIACFQLSPSFGTALMIKAREVLYVDKMFLGYLGATGTVLGILGYLLYYWKFYNYNLKKLLYFTVIFSAITNLFYLYIPNQWYLLGYNIAFGIFSGITFMSILAFFAIIIPKGSEGLIYACVTALSNLCVKGGSLFGGIIYDNLGYNWNVIISSILTFVCIFFISYLKIEKI